jgi:protein phosphatase
VIGDPIDVPEPGLVVLIGPAGAGKTTLATRLFARSEVLSSDALRAAVSGDESDQRATRPAFGILHREVGDRLAVGRLVVVDATNVEAPARAALRRLAAAAAVPAVAIVIQLPASDVHDRNRRRAGRIVPADIVDRHLASLDRLGTSPATIVARLRAEGFAAVHVLSSAAEIDAVAIRRVTSPPEPTADHATSAVRDPAEGSRPQLDPHAVAEIDVVATDLERGLLIRGPDQDERR